MAPAPLPAAVQAADQARRAHLLRKLRLLEGERLRLGLQRRVELPQGRVGLQGSLHLQQLLLRHGHPGALLGEHVGALANEEGPRWA